MPKKKYMHIYPFKVDFAEECLNENTLSIQDLMEGALANLIQKERKERIWKIEPFEGTYATLSEIKQNQDGTYSLGFAKFDMTSGPGKGNLSSGEISPFEMQEDEGFSHPTAALYDPSTNAFIAESSTSSISPDRMLSCISKEMPEDYLAQITLTPIIQEDVVAQVLKGGLIRKLELSVCPALLQETAFQKGISFNSFLKSKGMKSFSGEISITWSDKQSIPNEAKKIIRWACNLFASCTGGFLYPIKRCKVTQEKTNNERGSDLLDLLNARISDKMLVQVGSGRMVAFVEKYSALKAIYRKWKSKYFSN